MSGENNFKDTVNSLFKGLDAFISAKTVVGEAIHVGDTIILPLVDPLVLVLVHLKVTKKVTAVAV